jgi:hemerythrin-like metal-binding protein
MDKRKDPNAPAAADVAAELGYAPMDGIHAEFQALLDAANSPGVADWPLLIDRIDAHLRHHFAEEDRWMRETDFPARDCHIDEHAAVLKSSGEVLALALNGNTSEPRRFVEELARWFPGHATYLDSALAAWMCKRQYGGKPVVLHRQPAARKD